MSVLFSDIYFPGMQKKVDSCLPFLGVKLKSDSLSIGGKQVFYENATNFVLRDGEYIPVICLQDGVKNDEKMMDLHAFLNIGLTEVLLSIELNRKAFARSLISILTKERLFESLEDMLDFLHDRYSFSDALEWSIRSGNMRHDFPSVKKIVTLLNIARKSNPKFYFEQFFDLMKVAYTICLVYVNKDMSDVSIYLESGAAPAFCKGIERPILPAEILPETLNTGAVSYTTPEGKERVVTDGRGASIYLFLSFLHQVYSSFADFSRVSSENGNEKKESGICKKSCFDIIKRELSACLGNDAVGKYLKTGREASSSVDDFGQEMSSISRQTVFDARKAVKDGKGKKTTRALMDNLEMFRKATGFIGNDGNSLCYNDCLYESFEDMCSMAIYSVMLQKDYPILSETMHNGVLKQIEAAAYNNALQKVSGSIASLQTESDKEHKAKLEEAVKKSEEMEVQAQEAEKRIAFLESQLDNQRRITELQREEIGRLKTISECIYSEEDIPEEASKQEASLGEMISYLNGFKLTIAGGYDDMLRRLKELGLTEAVYVTTETQAFGRGCDTDFICICASFISHKIVQAVNSQFPDKRGETMYFNGTNADKLVRALYAFVKKWMEES